MKKPTQAHFGLPELMSIFGVNLLACLIGTSSTSLSGYQPGTHLIPGQVKARLQFLSLIVEHLAGAYDDVGIRRWFERKRTALGNRSPAEILVKDWNPDDPGPVQVRQLARSLTASPVT
jgi:hypothetical protein